MQVCVVGAGVVGLTTAYFLAREGHRVTIVDRNGLPGQGASYANGGQLSYSYVAPLAAPSALLSLPSYLFDRNSPLRFHLRARPAQWAWVMHFLAACWPSVYRRHMVELSTLAYLSREMIGEMVACEAIDFDFGHRGKLVVHRDRRSLQAAADLVAFQRDLGADQSLLDAEACLALEPAIEGMRGNLAGGVFTPSEDVGDCHKFCAALDGLLRDRYGVERLYHHKVGCLKTERQRLRAVRTNHGDIEADKFVMTAGLSSRELMQPLGVRLPLCGLKGYSLSVPVDGSHDTLKISVTDSQNKIVYARLGAVIRIAAMVDIGTAQDVVDQERTDMLKSHVRASFPGLGPLDTAKVWAGDRPATAQGKPIVGASPIENLYLNVGHGALGFTLASGSAKLVTELIQGGPTTIDARPFRLGTVH